MKALSTMLLAGSALWAADCVPSHLDEKQTLARFQELDRAAQSALDQGQFAAAARQYREAACLAPKSARAFYGLGIAEAAAGNFPAARKALEAACAIPPDRAMPLAMLVRGNAAQRGIDQGKAALRTGAPRFPTSGALRSGTAPCLAG